MSKFLEQYRKKKKESWEPIQLAGIDIPLFLRRPGQRLIQSTNLRARGVFESQIANLLPSYREEPLNDETWKAWAKLNKVWVSTLNIEKPTTRHGFEVAIQQVAAISIYLFTIYVVDEEGDLLFEDEDERDTLMSAILETKGSGDQFLRYMEQTNRSEKVEGNSVPSESPVS